MDLYINKKMYLCKMFFKPVKYWMIILLLSVFAISCGEYSKILKSDNIELKLEKAIEYYEAEDYYKAQTLLSDLRTYYKGTDQAEKINYYNAYCHYGNGELYLAAYFFKEFAMTFPSSIYKEEAEYMSSYCYYLLSPPTSLEQTYTHRAISEMQLFIERYPESDKRDTVNYYIDNLQRKLEKKAFDIAYLYYKIGSFRAAVTALNNALIDYPDTHFREEIMFYIIKANYDYAANSVFARQAERYKLVVDSYHDFVDMYPESEKIKEAEKLYENSLKFIQENDGL
jgi:outer membrane protein assembly factor BamD